MVCRTDQLEFFAGDPVANNFGSNIFDREPSSQNIDITGTGFASGSSASFSGGNITVNNTSYNDPTLVTANITINVAASTGTRNVSVTNPDAGVGTGSSIFFTFYLHTKKKYYLD